MPTQSCPHYPENPSAPSSRCKACGVQVTQSSVSEGQPKGAYPGVKPAAGTALNTALSGSGAKIDGKHH